MTSDPGLSPSSRIPGFHRLEVPVRRSHVAVSAEENPGHLPLELADRMIENVVGTYGLPLGVVTNVRVNGVDRLVPLAVEEPSIVAAASNAARMIRTGGGFRAWSDPPIMIAQVQLEEGADPADACARLEAAEERILELADRLDACHIVMGGQGRSSLSSLLMGSKSERVVRLATVPVTIVKSVAFVEQEKSKKAKKKDKERKKREKREKKSKKSKAEKGGDSA